MMAKVIRGLKELLLITGEAGLVPILLVENRSMPQGGMEDVCRVVVAMGDPMSHELSLQVPHDFEELDRLGQGSLHSDGPGHDDLYECLVTVTQKTTSRCLPPVIVL